MFFIPMSFYEWGLCSWGFIMMITEAFYWHLEHCYLSACIWWRPLCWTKSAFPLMNIVASTIFYKAITKWGKWGKTWMLILLLVIEFWITLLWSFGEPSMHWVTTCRKHAKNNSVCVLHSKAQNDRTADIFCQTVRVILTTFTKQSIHLHLFLLLFHISEVTLLSYQWLQFRVINEVELWDEVIVVLVAGVDVGLCAHVADAVKVMDVNVHKYPKETTQDLLAHLLEVLGERYTCSVTKVRKVTYHVSNSLN